MQPNDYEFLFKEPVDPKNEAKNPVFEYGLLERVTVTSPLIAFISYVPLVIGLILFSLYQGYTTGSQAMMIWLAGLLFWSPVEYAIHRFFYHRRSKNRIVRGIQLLLHGFHHKHPSDRDHLFMPFYGGWLIFFLFWVLSYLVLKDLSFLFLSGFLGGYLYYVFLHYYIHNNPPPFKFLEGVWRHHLLHHYQYPEHNFGFTTTLWDRLFGTMSPREKKAEEHSNQS